MCLQLRHNGKVKVRGWQCSRWQFFKRQGLTSSGPIALATLRPHNTHQTFDNLITQDLLEHTTDSVDESNWDSSMLKVNLLAKSFSSSLTSGADLVDYA